MRGERCVVGGQVRSFSEGWAIGIARHSLPLRGEVDAAHQATGVPSLGQESVNVVNGPR